MAGTLVTKILYISHNGITDHIGEAQVAPYNLGLARLGYKIHILSAEKPGREKLKQKYREFFAEAGIKWSFITYHNRPQVLAQAWDVVRMRRLAIKIAEREKPDLVHCRSYLPLEIGIAVKRRIGCRFLIDFRHFFIESGLQDSRYPFVYRMLARREGRYFKDADHVITLTKRAAQILDERYPDRRGLDRFTVIPCCADFDQFDTSRLDLGKLDEYRKKLGLAPAQTLLIYLGSIGAVYLLREMLLLFRELVAVRPDARFLFVANNGRDEILCEAATLGIPSERILYLTAPRDEVPYYLALADLSVMFFRPDLSLAGCSPTKMAELFAMNVPIISNAGVGDLDLILRSDQNGSCVVSDFEPSTLRRAVLEVIGDPSRREPIRSGAGAFRLTAGIERYASVYAKIVGPPDGSNRDVTKAVAS